MAFLTRTSKLYDNYGMEGQHDFSCIIIVFVIIVITILLLLLLLLLGFG